MTTDDASNSFDRLETFGICQLACELFHDFWADSEILGKDFRGRELLKQPVRSLDSICANSEEGYGRGFNQEMPQHFKTGRGEARESRGRYLRSGHLLTAELIQKRVATLHLIIGGLTDTIRSIEAKQMPVTRAAATRHPQLATRHCQ